MHNSTTANKPAAQAGSIAKVVFVLLTFLLPVGGALFFFDMATASNVKLDKVDFVFCLTTLTNCLPISPFFDIAGWKQLWVTNIIAFTIWFVYAIAIYGLLTASKLWKLFSSVLIVFIPVGLSALSLLFHLLQGAHM